MPVPRSDPVRRRPPGARRAALLELLRNRDGGLAVSDIAPLAGLHPNTVRAHLDVLVRTGLATRRTDARTTPGRPRELYEATGAPEGDRSYQLLAQVLAARLAELTDDPAAQGVEAGRHWAARDARPPSTAPVGAAAAGLPAPGAQPTAAGLREALAPVMTMLRATGFAPELTADVASIRLHHCPFRELAGLQPEIVCGAHLGLIQGELDRIGAGVSATRILPFVQPDLCIAELRVAPTTDDQEVGSGHEVGSGQ